ncbi:MAG TPA: molybdenum cofactor biosynthesis protein MoaE [Chitinophagales bacterium]|nr:molybdenum cofactor biosynthesis protein MoaE [Chitinophagales bacterium]
MTKKKHSVLVNGPITSDFIGNSIAKHSTKTNIGAHAIFLGQVRKDLKENTAVANIEYSAHNEMAEKIFEAIREQAFEKFDMVCMHIYHSLGKVNVGEVSLFVFVSCKHRAQSFEALEWIVEEIKNKVPIWKKENYENGNYSWIGVSEI